MYKVVGIGTIYIYHSRMMQRCLLRIYATSIMYVASDNPLMLDNETFQIINEIIHFQNEPI